MGIEIYFSRSQSGSDSVAIVEEVTLSRAEGEIRFAIDGVEHDGISWIRTNVGSIFTGSSRLSINPFQGMSLRGLVYSQIWKELPAVEALFRA
jgi:hypothetical protein